MTISFLSKKLERKLSLFQGDTTINKEIANLSRDKLIEMNKNKVLESNINVKSQTYFL